MQYSAEANGRLSISLSRLACSGRALTRKPTKFSNSCCSNYFSIERPKVKPGVFPARFVRLVFLRKDPRNPPNRYRVARIRLTEEFLNYLNTANMSFVLESKFFTLFFSPAFWMWITIVSSSWYAPELAYFPKYFVYP